VFNWVKCHVFNSHRGDWRKVGTCHEIEVCIHCLTLISQEDVHQLGEPKYENKDSCKKVRRCKNCMYFRQDTLQHEEWTVWEYMEDESCNQVCHCVRCVQEQTRLFHQYGEFKPLESDPCTLLHVCARCGEEEKREDHQWSAWDVGEPYRERNCQCCHKEDSEYVGYSSSTYTPDYDYDDDMRGYGAYRQDQMRGF
jgi:hypothetical protein